MSRWTGGKTYTLDVTLDEEVATHVYRLAVITTAVARDNAIEVLD
jgi:hypothetical protein